MTERDGGATQLIEQKFDPKSRTTGIALVATFEKRGRTAFSLNPAFSLSPAQVQVVFGANFQHRGLQIKAALNKRRAIRRLTPLSTIKYDLLGGSESKIRNLSEAPNVVRVACKATLCYKSLTLSLSSAQVC